MKTLDLLKASGKKLMGLKLRRGKTGGSDQVNQVCGSNGLQVESGRESSRVDPYFSNNFFFFFEIDAICQSFMSFSIVIKFSLVILLPITTKHLIPKFGATLIPTF